MGGLSGMVSLTQCTRKPRFSCQWHLELLPFRIIVTCALRAMAAMTNVGGGHTVLQKKTAPSSHMDSARMDAHGLMLTSTITNTLASLVRLNVLETLAAAGEGAQLTAAELARRAVPGKTINVQFLERMLRLVSSNRILTEAVATGPEGQSERRFGMGAIGTFFVEDAENGSFVNQLHWMLYRPRLNFWDSLDAALADDSQSTFQRANGGLSVWEYGQRNPEFAAKFKKAMTENSKLYLRAILDAFHGFEEVKVLLDVGGGSGAAISQIIARHPHIKGINFDQPHVVAANPPIPGVTHVGGNFLESVPAGADVIFMKWILHDWDDAACVQILKNCYKALPAHGKLIVADCILPDESVFDEGDKLSFNIDVMMLAAFGHARERTEHDVRKVASDAGFQKVDVICKVDLYCITELRKA